MKNLKKNKAIKQEEIDQEEVIELIVEKRFRHHIFLPKSVNENLNNKKKKYEKKEKQRFFYR